MNLLKNRLNEQKGQLATVMNLIIAVFVVGVIGLFAFELTRYLLARDELKTNVEVAALSCQTTLASSGDPTNDTNQQNAMNSALQLFRQNSVLGQSMANATLSTDPAQLNPAPGQAQICFQFLDPLTRQPVNQTGAGVSAGVTDPSVAGTLIRAVGSYCYEPAFGRFIGLANAQFTFQVSALAGIPKIDLMVLLDISGGMDDNTSVSFYQRYQGPTGTNWMILPNPVNGGTSQGQLWSIFCPLNPNDPGVPPGANGLQPYELERMDNSSCLTVHYSDGSLGGPSRYLGGAGMGTPPGDAPCLPTSSLSQPAKNIAKAINKKTINGRQNRSAELVKICSKISGNPKSCGLNKTLISQLDDKLSNIYFKPQITVNLSMSGGDTTGAGVTNGLAIYPGVGPDQNPPIPPDYVGDNGRRYFDLSQVPGPGADTTPAVLPTISGYCPGGVSSGPAAPTVFTGLFMNGVVGAENPSIPGMNFHNAATAIEASLGNLESMQNAQRAGTDTVALNATPQAGWYAFYYLAARPFLQPFMSNLDAIVGFINEMAIISDIHYGFIAFNDNIGSNAGSVGAPVNNISSRYNFTMPNPDGSASINRNYPLPNIHLSANDSKQATIINILPTLSVWGGRNLTRALENAKTQLLSNGRPGANKVIVVVTSGIPNGGDTPTAAIAKAAQLRQAGIPVYVVCTSMDSSYDANDDNAYTDVGGSAGGVAGAAGHGSKYYRVTYVDPNTTYNQLVSVFANIARRLVSIVQN
jgi:hypothetical protein